MDFSGSLVTIEELFGYALIVKSLTIYADLDMKSSR